MKLNIEKLKKTGKLGGIWYLMTGFKLLFIAAMTTLGISAVLRICSFLLIRFIVDRVFTDPELLKTIYLYIGMILLLAGVEAGFSFINGKCAALSAEGIIRRLRNMLFDHIQRLPFSYHDHMETGNLLERVTSDVEALQRFYLEQVMEIGRIGALFIFSIAGIASMKPFLAVISLVCFPLVMAQALWFFKRIEKAYSHCQDQEAKISSLLQENISGIRVVQAFSRQEFEIGKFNDESMERYKRVKKLVLMNACYWPFSDIICFFQLMLIYSLGGWMAMNGEISIGTYIAVIGLVNWAIWPIRDLGRVVIQASSGVVSFDRISRILKEKPEKTNGKLQLVKGSRVEKGVSLEFERVSFSYKEGETVLNDISFSCKPGHMVAVVGPTGSGKSTLINIIPRFYCYAKGSIRIDGRELSTIPLSDLRKQIGIVEQEPFLFSRTIRENIAYSHHLNGDGSHADTGTISMEMIEEAAKAAAIHDVIMEFPDGYETVIGEKGTTLSGGQRQRIAIARTILRPPGILILDDATSSVDAETEALIIRALSGIMEGRTSFVIAHRIETVKRADLIIVLDRGSIAQMGTHENLIGENGLYKKMFGSQIATEFSKESVTACGRAGQQERR